MYQVLIAFGVADPAVQHAVKKLLCAGLRDKADRGVDLEEALDAVKQAIWHHRSAGPGRVQPKDGPKASNEAGVFTGTEFTKPNEP